MAIVNWVRGNADGLRKIFIQHGNDADAPFEVYDVPRISASLSPSLDVTGASQLEVNTAVDFCHQGQTQGRLGFVYKKNEIEELFCLLEKEPRSLDVVFPFLIGDEMLGCPLGAPPRYVIDFYPMDAIAAQTHKSLFARVETQVLPPRIEAAEKEKKRNAAALATNPSARVNRHHAGFLERWWLLSFPRPEVLERLALIPRYIACSCVSKRQIFTFVRSDIHPNAKLQTFLLEDDYSYGILASKFHWIWYKERCTTNNERFNYNKEAIWSTFPWPQAPVVADVKAIAEKAVAFRELRWSLMTEHGLTLRQVHKTMELPGKNQLRDAQTQMDRAVAKAYGFSPNDDPLEVIYNLNVELASREASGDTVTGPGLPEDIEDPANYVSEDAIVPQQEWLDTVVRLRGF